MSGVRVVWLSALAGSAAFFGCGGGEANLDQGPGGAVGFEIFVSRAWLDQIGAFQLALVKNGSQYSCEELQRTCLIEAQLPADALVRVEDADGKSHRALIVPVDLQTSGSSRVQDTTLRNVPVGKDYKLIVEALSKESPPRLLGSSCTLNVEVRTGNNERVSTNPIQFIAEPQQDGGMGSDAGVGLACDPRFEK